MNGGCIAPGTGSGPTGGGTNPSPPGSNSGGGEGVTLVNPLKANNLEDLLALVVQAAVRLGAIVLILMLIFTGFKFVVAQGKPEEINTAKKMLLWVIIGGLVLLGAEGLSRVIQSTANTL